MMVLDVRILLILSLTIIIAKVNLVTSRGKGETETASNTPSKGDDDGTASIASFTGSSGSTSSSISWGTLYEFEDSIKKATSGITTAVREVKEALKERRSGKKEKLYYPEETEDQNGDWRNADADWKDAVKYTEIKSVLKNILGTTRYVNGEPNNDWRVKPVTENDFHAIVKIKIGTWRVMTPDVGSAYFSEAELTGNPGHILNNIKSKIALETVVQTVFKEELLDAAPEKSSASRLDLLGSQSELPKTYISQGRSPTPIGTILVQTIKDILNGKVPINCLTSDWDKKPSTDTIPLFTSTEVGLFPTWSNEFELFAPNLIYSTIAHLFVLALNNDVMIPGLSPGFIDAILGPKDKDGYVKVRVSTGDLGPAYTHNLDSLVGSSVGTYPVDVLFPGIGIVMDWCRLQHPAVFNSKTANILLGRILACFVIESKRDVLALFRGTLLSSEIGRELSMNPELAQLMFPKSVIHMPWPFATHGERLYDKEVRSKFYRFTETKFVNMVESEVEAFTRAIHFLGKKNDGKAIEAFYDNYPELTREGEPPLATSSQGLKNAKWTTPTTTTPYIIEASDEPNIILQFLPQDFLKSVTWRIIVPRWQLQVDMADALRQALSPHFEPYFRSIIVDEM